MNNLEEEEVVRNTGSIKDVRKRRMLMGLGLIFAIFVVGTFSASLSWYVTLRTAAEDGTVLAQQIEEQCQKPGTTDPELAMFCPKASEVVAAAPADVKQNPVPGPAGPEGEQGPVGETGEVGPEPSPEQVLVAVRSFCIDSKTCRGKDGSDATPAQVANAVSVYCNDRGLCRGPSGSDGVNGQDGEDAPPITQSQIVAAVTTYCAANNNCRGPAGTDGSNGQDSNVPGPPGSTGVVQVIDNCDSAPSGQVISDVTPSYNPDSQTITISCTYKDDETGQILQNGSNNE